MISIDKLFMDSIASFKVDSCSVFACLKDIKVFCFWFCFCFFCLARTIGDCYWMCSASTGKGAFFVIVISIRSRIIFCYRSLFGDDFSSVRFCPYLVQCTTDLCNDFRRWRWYDGTSRWIWSLMLLAFMSFYTGIVFPTQSCILCVQIAF